jgi:hypothetical protein
MWGFHIGLGFATWVTFGGFFALVLLAVIFASPLYGGIIMFVYWLGRALPLSVPNLLVSVSLPTELPAIILQNRSIYHRVAGLGLMWSCAATMLVALQM